MNAEELTKFRLEKLEEQFAAIQVWQEEAHVRLTQATATLAELAARAEENKKTLKGIFASVVVGVTMLMITTIIAKIT